MTGTNDNLSNGQYFLFNRSVLLVMTDCEKRIGYVIFDCICLLLGAAECRAALTEEAAVEMAEAAKPVLSMMEKYIVTLADKEARRWTKSAQCSTWLRRFGQADV